MWKKLLPRLYDLYCHSDRSNPDNYFHDFSERLQEGFVLKTFQQIEFMLEQLDESAWNDLRSRAVSYVNVTDSKKHRGWQQLFSALEEAKGYIYLRETGYSQISFLHGESLPDLIATNGNSAALLEVKTINASDREIAYFNDRSVVQEARNVMYLIPAKLDAKLLSTIAAAKKQLRSYRPNETLRRICLLLIRFDMDVRKGSKSIEQLKNIEQRESDKTCEVVCQITFSL